MGPEIQILDAAPVPLLSVRRQVAWPELAPSIRAMFDEIWPAVRSRGLKFGHNVCVYHAPTKAGCELECGVQVSSGGDSASPSGRAARAVHVGDYAKMGQAYDALDAYFREQGLNGGLSWEVYGDWDDDPSKVTTDVFRLIV